MKRLLDKLTPPPHIAWPAFVVLLLSISVAAGVRTIIAAHSTDRPEILADLQQNTALVYGLDGGLAWTARVALIEAGAEAPRPVEVRITDPQGRGVRGLEGMLRLEDRGRVVAVAPLREVRTGVYRTAFEDVEPGTYRLVVVTDRPADGVRFAPAVTLTIPA